MEFVISLDNKRELFVDNFLIDSLDGTSLKLHHPTPANVAIKYGKNNTFKSKGI